MSVLTLILSAGGIFIWPIGLLSIVAFTVVIERLWRLMPLERVFAKVQARAHEALLRGGAQEALKTLGNKDALSRVLQAGLSVRDRGPETMRAVALDAAQREVPKLERGIGVILMTTQVAPLLGLLGTVVGLIDSYHEASLLDSATRQAIASGISMALAATALGLAVAIPAFLSYGFLNFIAGKLIDRLEHAATDLPLLLRENS
jgi:biopolymer transport protein ExbB